MQITVFSFLMSVVWSSVVILLIHIFRKKQFFLNGFGLLTAILFCALSIGRMVIAVELPFTHEIPVPEIYNRFYNTIRTSPFSFGEHGVSFVSLFLFLWCTVSVALLAVFFIRELLARKQLRTYRFVSSDQLQSALEDVQEKFGGKLHIRIFECPDIRIPMGTGILNKCILMPQAEYSDEELRHIVMHEYMHFRNKDLQILLLTELFTRIFWWNPFIYILKADIRRILELKCDLSVITNITETQRTDYLRTLRSCLEQSKKCRGLAPPPVSAQLVRKNNQKEEMLERFKLIAYPVQKNYIRFQTVSILCFSLLMLLSYSFVLQPQYQPPQEEIYSHSGVDEAGTLSGYILEKKDGSYIFIDESGLEFKLTPKTLEVFSEMFEVRKE
ncbi:MAG: M56 family metallopeptidase [Clostridia bacterium]|nr:M56 family metallopeptidase [Clostridia bacterium]